MLELWRTLILTELGGGGIGAQTTKKYDTWHMQLIVAIHVHEREIKISGIEAKLEYTYEDSGPVL